MKIDVIVVYVPRYRKGHELDFVPTRTGIHLAAITPRRHRVRVIHQQLQAIDLGTDADLIALSFFSGFAPEEFRLAGLFRARGTCRPTCGSGRNTTTSSGPGTVCRCHPAAECMPEALGGAGHCPATGTTAAKRIYSVIMSTMSTSQNG